MKKNLVFFLALILLSAILTPDRSLFAQALHLVAATDPTWPPMELIDENRQIAGFDIDLMNAAAEAGGFTVEYVKTPWDTIFEELLAGEYDAVISAVNITDERKGTMDFSIPYFNAGQVLVVHADAAEATGLEDMKGKTVGAQTGTNGAFEVEKAGGVVLKMYDDLSFAFRDLAAGEIDGVVADSVIAANFALRTADYLGLFRIGGGPFTDEPCGVAVKKGNTEVLEAINRGLKAVLASQLYEELIDKWLR